MPKVQPRARIIADSNRDGRTTMDEWAKIYKKMGVPFDELNPRKLTEEQLKNYFEGLHKK